MKKLMLIFGTRPEAIKMCPLVKELKKRNCFQVKVCVTGQHREMLKQVLDIFKVEPDYNLSIMKEGQDLFDITKSVLQSVSKVLQSEKPDIVLVHGDTTTAFASALACYYMHISVGHVEAGLRTYDIYSPFPEEYNRQAVSIISQYNFAPTERARNNLINEGKNTDTIWVTGNTGIDALKTTVKENYMDENLAWADGHRLVLITAHRRENIGEPMHHMFCAIKSVLDEYEDVRAIYPVHMNPEVRKIAKNVFGDDERIRLIEPLDAISFHNYMNKSYLILTDSGGIQEEAPALGKPVLVMRETTERPEGIKAGTIRLVGTSEKKIYNEFVRLLSDKEEYNRMRHAVNPYGDGHASERIADILEYGEIRSCLDGLKKGDNEDFCTVSTTIL